MGMPGNPAPVPISIKRLTGGSASPTGRREEIQKVLIMNILHVADGGEIKAGIPIRQFLLIARKRCQLAGRELDPE